MTVRTLLLRLWREERGLAMIEFAFVAPVVLFLILAGLELVNYSLAHMRVNQIAMTVADNGGRVVTGIDEANIYEVFAGANVIGEPLDFEANGRVILSSLQDNGHNGANAGQVINWQRCWGDLDVEPAYGVEGTGRDDATLADGMGRAGSRIISTPGTAVMVVEVIYQYQPLVGPDILPVGGQIRHESAFNVRGRQNNNISNTQSLQELSCDAGAGRVDLGGGNGNGGNGGGGNGNGNGGGGNGNGNGGGGNGNGNGGGGNGNGGGNGGGGGNGNGNGGGNGNGNRP